MRRGFPLTRFWCKCWAFIGALYCSGHTPKEILGLAESHSFLHIFKVGLLNKSLTDMSRLKGFLHKHVKDNFEDLVIPLHISVTNLNSGKYEIKSTGPLIEYIAASCALPIIFKPVTINKDQYVDNGLLNNLPVEPLEEKCDKIIGVSVSSHEPKPKIVGRLSVAERCMKLDIWNTVEDRLKRCTVVLDIDKAYIYGSFSFAKSQELYEIGYEASMQVMDEIKTKMK